MVVVRRQSLVALFNSLFGEDGLIAADAGANFTALQEEISFLTLSLSLFFGGFFHAAAILLESIV